MKRPEFLKILTGGLVAFWSLALIYPISRYLKKPPDPDSDKQVSEVTVCKVSELAPGQSKSFQFGKRPGMLICTKAGQYMAYDATCTHLGCTTQYRAEKKDIYCACHAGVYDINGKNIAGPPPRPLQALKVSVKGNDIVVSKA